MSDKKTRHTQTDPNIRRCSLCKEFKTMGEFRIRVPKRGWYHSQCRKCMEKNRKIDRRTPERKEKEREYWLISTYGITIQEYEDILLAQGGVCGICKHTEHRANNSGGVRRLSVDHCHDTGSVRGLLCGDCNTAIGLIGENRESLLMAVEYLDKYLDNPRRY